MARQETLARRYGLAGLGLGLALPVVLWHSVAVEMARDFRWETGYLVTGWTGFTLMAVGLLLFIPVLFAIGRDPRKRFTPRAPKALAAWSMCLYLLGLGLCTQVQQIVNGISA